ncbi:MAG: phospholipase D-like domain-containing protein [Comamonadaceae bacterium]|nr:phospholipase D-like domain-containing protein [Comamonadaceae bacterium]
MFAAIERARHSVLLESYIVEDAALAQRLADLLARKRAEGVAVAMIYDAVGSIGTRREFFDGLRADGDLVCEFNPVNPAATRGYWKITHRNHRKVLVVDREIGFTGGINISSVYSSGSFGARGGARDPDTGWRDTQIELQGPAAAALEDMLRATWERQRCPGTLAPPPVRALPVAAPAGPHLVRIVPSGPEEPYSRLYTLLLAAIDAAERSVHLTMAYFAPSGEMIEALTDAARRGVDVQMVLPSRSDFRPVLHAGRSHYGDLLEAGVQIHELQDAVLHAKTAVIDGVVLDRRLEQPRLAQHRDERRGRRRRRRRRLRRGDAADVRPRRRRQRAGDAAGLAPPPVVAAGDRARGAAVRTLVVSDAPRRRPVVRFLPARESGADTAPAPPPLPAPASGAKNALERGTVPRPVQKTSGPATGGPPRTRS